VPPCQSQQLRPVVLARLAEGRHPAELDVVEQVPDRPAAGAFATPYGTRRPLGHGGRSLEERVQIARRQHEHLEPVDEPRQHEARPQGSPRFDRGLQAPQQPGAVRRVDVRVVQVEDDGQRPVLVGAGPCLAADDGASLVAAAGPFLHRNRRFVEVRDLDRQAVDVELEVLARQTLDRSALPVGDDDVDLDDLDVDRIDERLAGLCRQHCRSG